jgi:hypothetical protein
MGSRCIFPIKNKIEMINFWVLELATINCIILGFASIMLQKLLTILFLNKTNQFI